jgi:hypothetical protein
MPTASCENVAAIDASVAAIARRMSSISSGPLMIRRRSVISPPLTTFQPVSLSVSRS